MRNGKGRRTEIRKSEDRGRRAEDGGQRAEDRRQKAEDRSADYADYTD